MNGRARQALVNAKDSRMETFVVSVGRMSTSTFSSLGPWSWTSESDFESDHDLTLVSTQSEVSLGLQRYVSEKEMGEVAMTSRFALDT